MSKLIKNPESHSLLRNKRRLQVSLASFPSVLLHHEAPESRHIIAGSRLQQQYLTINGIRAVTRIDAPQPWQYSPDFAGHSVDFEPTAVCEENLCIDMKLPEQYRHHLPYRDVQKSSCVDPEILQSENNKRLADLQTLHGLSSSLKSMRALSVKAYKTTQE